MGAGTTRRPLVDQRDFGTLLWRVNTTGNVQTVEALGNLVIIGGHFTSVDRVTRVRIARSR